MYEFNVVPKSAKNDKNFCERNTFWGKPKIFRVDFGFSLCYNAPNDKGNVFGIYIGMDNF